MSKSNEKERRIRPGLTPESREDQLIAAATNLAEQQILDGTASSQVITHYLKLGTQREKLERDKLRHENELLQAKTKAVKSEQNSEALYKEVVKAFGIYSGKGGPEHEVDDY